MRAGFAVGSLRLGGQGPRNEAVLRRFLLKSGVGVLYADEQTTHHYGAAYRQLRKQGTPMPTNGMWIAALVLQYSLVLCARGVHLTCCRSCRACREAKCRIPGRRRKNL